VSLPRFQASLARLITDPDFRDRVRARDTEALEADLTPLERARLCRIAHDRGLDINRTLHKGFRLGKLRAMLPLTCQALGPKRLTREVAAFWSQRAPSSFYFIAEALDFCDFLAARRLPAEYLNEVLDYERAVLELERPRLDAPPEQAVRFRHDPAVLLATLATRRWPRRIARRDCMAYGTRGEDGRPSWRLVDVPERGIAGDDGADRLREG
jgi:hypothetical protein